MRLLRHLNVLNVINVFILKEVRQKLNMINTEKAYYITCYLKNIKIPRKLIFMEKLIRELVIWPT